MRNQGRTRRARGQKDADEDQFNTVREESKSSSYARHHHTSRYSEPHRNASSSTPSRMTYDRNAETSRNIRDDGWGTGSAGHERFDYGAYHHTDHDSYDTSARRDPENWRGNGEGQYSSRGDWSASYHQSEASASYPEPSTWSASATTPNQYSNITTSAHAARSMGSPYRTPNPYYEGSRSPGPYDGVRGYYHESDQWSQRDAREPLPEDRIDLGASDKPRNQGWRKENRREKGAAAAAPQKFQSDSGWSTRKKGKEWINLPQSRWEEPPPNKNEAAHKEDRSWEPAESWKSGHRSYDHPSSKQQQHRDGGRQSQRSGKQQKTSRRNPQPSKPKSDYRAEDINLNNWTRRDVSTSSKKSNEKQTSSTSKRKHPRSPSRSRSRSLESHRSAHSSYAHSRSRSSSPIPKRRRKDASPTLRSPSPRERERLGWVPAPREEERHGSRSPSPYRSPPVYLRRSPTYSDMSSEPSRSRSPAGKRRAVHRLPMVPPAQVQVQAQVAGPPTLSERKSRKAKKQRNGQNQANRNGENQRQRYPDPDTPAMPPPPNPPPGMIHEPSERPSKITHHSQLALQSEGPTRIAPIRNAGFKPIAKPNSALRRFFPGDDEETELGDNQDRHPRDPHFGPTSSVLFHQSAHTHTSNGHYESNGTTTPPYPPPRTVPERRGWSPPPLAAVDSGYAGRLDGPPFVRSTPPGPLSADPSRARPAHPGSSWPSDSVPRPTWLDDAEMAVPSKPPTWFPPEDQTGASAELPAQFVHDNTGWNDSRRQNSQRGKETVEVLPRITKPPMRLTSAVPDRLTPPHGETPSQSSDGAAKELYMILNQVGEGTFGKVYKAQNTTSKMFVALKRIRMETERDGFPVTAMREIKLLQSLKHQNVVRLYEMMVSNGSVFMVFEYMDHDLTGILSQTQFKFTDAHLKSLCHQMLAGLAYLHHKGVIHRDIKGSNILLNNRGELKLADFGLARFYHKRRRSDYTNRVITLWYRPPELLFGATIYAAEVDMWSAGCIMLELFTKKPVFQGNDEIHQLHVVFKILGTPTPERWLGLINLPWYELVKPREVLPNRFRELFQKWMSPAALDLAERLLTYDPSRRVSAQAAMDAPYFTQESPLAERPTGLSTLEGEWHELETKVERQKKRKKTESTVV